MNRRACLWIRGCLAVAALLATADVSEARPAMVTFDVEVPEYTPVDATLYIAGNIESLGPWDPGKVALGRLPDGRHAITLVLPLGTDLRYKFTRGSWGTVEKGPDFEEIPDRQLEVTGDETIPIVVDNWRDFGESPRSYNISGDFRLHLDFHSSNLGNDRTIIVYLPPGYASESERRYPVLYMHDGQNLFDARSSFIGVEWNVDETVTRMVESGEVDPLIVVGVYNTPGRVDEYTPAPDRARGGGRARDYASFIVKELKPFIDANYRTLSDRDHTGVMGSSLGGLVSLYLGWVRPDVFSRIGAMSTSYGWADDYIINLFEGGDLPEGLRIWIDMGTAEGRSASGRDEVSEMIVLHRRMRDVLIEKGLEMGRTLRYMEDEGAIHNERAWAARFPKALKFLFPAGG